VLAKMPGKFQESRVLFAYAVQYANRANRIGGEPDDLPP